VLIVTVVISLLSKPIDDKHVSPCLSVLLHRRNNVQLYWR